MNTLKIFCDFDGTITKCDTVDKVLTELAEPHWEEIEDEWIAGKISARECMEKQIPLIKGGWTSVKELLNSLELRNGFKEFVSWCKFNNISISVVSDGLDRFIEYILQKNEIRVDAVYANHLVEKNDSSLAISFSPTPRFFGCQSGVCKCQIAGQSMYQVIRVVIGDGRSDFCWAKEAELLFARAKLVDYCQIEGLPYNEFTDFVDLQQSLASFHSGEFTSKLIFNKPVPAIVSNQAQVRI